MKTRPRLIAALFCLALFSIFCAPTAEAKDRPNVLWIVVDDMSANFSCYGEKLIQTPHIDRLAKEGTRFTSAFVTAPVCSPCRSALMTGMYQTSLGVHHHRSGRGTEKIHLPEGIPLVPALFQEAGYYTCIGSGLPETNYLVQSVKPDKRLGKTDYNFEWDPKMYDGSDWSGRKPGQPFFMQIQMPGGKLRGGTEASAKKLSKVAQETFGDAVQTNDVKLAPYYPRDPVLLQDWAAYLDTVRLTDLYVGKVIDRLEKEGILDNTLIIFMTDHGISHARAKQFLYDSGTHIPFVVRGPGIEKNAVRKDLIEHIDMGPISLGAAGLPVPKNMHAKDVFAKDYQPRDAIFAARDRCDETVERLRSVRTEQFLYIRNFFPQRPMLQPNAYKDAKAILQSLRKLHAEGKLSELSEELLFSPTRPVDELYAWTEDPWQIRNLADDPAYATKRKELSDRLDRWMKETNDHGLESEAMYDSDMEGYRRGRPAVEKNIQLMKKWAAEGK